MIQRRRSSFRAPTVRSSRLGGHGHGVADDRGKDVGGVQEGEEYDEMRIKAKELGAVAHRAVEEGGSSFEDVTALIEELKVRRRNRE
ncbi:uncharacterized protein A4U43_C02F20100 [Asparagus officinalis]|uniref:Uncharacterized protein n=1 Tax=Asparagus officinalis TaxID=4686 RepID=A0A5P1FNL0_ASPOF|nr:uncharacterized protein A4U43_C02F20100 [Asparagus officinalis]